MQKENVVVKKVRRENTQRVLKNNQVNIPELVSGSSTQAVTQQRPQRQALKMPKQVRQYPYLIRLHGFTLIELLVVVLIIGILAAIAVPQYQKAVVKSRLAAIKPVIAAIKNAEERYYLENGHYTEATTSIADTLDIDFPCSTVQDGSVLKCDNYFLIDTIQGSDQTIRAAYCPGYQTNLDLDEQSCWTNRDFTYTVYLDHSSTPGKSTCAALTDLGRAVCKGE